MAEVIGMKAMMISDLGDLVEALKPFNLKRKLANELIGYMTIAMTEESKASDAREQAVRAISNYKLSPGAVKLLESVYLPAFDRLAEQGVCFSP